MVQRRARHHGPQLHRIRTVGGRATPQSEWLPTTSGSPTPTPTRRGTRGACRARLGVVMALPPRTSRRRPIRRLAWVLLQQRRHVRQGAWRLPVGEADRITVGHTTDFFQQSLREPHAEDSLWQRVDQSEQVGDVTAPVNLTAGWDDIFLVGQLRDYERLHDAGRAPQLTIGPWSHLDPRAVTHSLREGMAWFDEHLRGWRIPRPRACPRVGEWRRAVDRTLELATGDDAAALLPPRRGAPGHRHSPRIATGQLHVRSHGPDASSRRRSSRNSRSQAGQSPARSPPRRLHLHNDTTEREPRRPRHPDRQHPHGLHRREPKSLRQAVRRGPHGKVHQHH